MTPLHSFGDFLREVLATIPLSAVRALFLATLIALLVWVLCLPKDRTEPPGGARTWDENLKPVAALALLVQIVIYTLL